MKLKEVEGELQQVKSFQTPNVTLEQYPTSPHIAAHMVFTIGSSYNDLEDKVIVDLGCGCGILGIGAAMLEAKRVIGVDVDEKALEIAVKNCKDMEVEMDFVLSDVEDLTRDKLNNLWASVGSTEEEEEEGEEEEKEEEEEEESGFTEEKRREDDVIDVVIMNPPFGTKKKGMDMIFLKKAIELAGTTVYSLHKTSTRTHIEKKAKEWGVGMQVLAELRWNIPQMYKFHKKKSVDIEVDFIRFDVHNKKKTFE